MHRLSQFTKTKKNRISQQENESRTLVFQPERVEAKVESWVHPFIPYFPLHPIFEVVAYVRVKMKMWSVFYKIRGIIWTMFSQCPSQWQMVLNLLGFSLHYGFHEISFNESINNPQLLNLNSPKRYQVLLFNLN